jgi:hypothetical protein
MTSEFTGKIEQDTIYRERQTELVGVDTHGNSCCESIHDYLEAFVGRRIKITIETLDEDPKEELVTVTYREILKRCDYSGLTWFGVNPHYLNEGGDPTAIKDLTKHQALYFMTEEEFAGRCHSEVNA